METVEKVRSIIFVMAIFSAICQSNVIFTRCEEAFVQTKS